MSKKDWLWMTIVGAIGAGATFLARWAYRRLKQGKFDKFLTQGEKKNLIEAIEGFLEEEK